MKRVKRYTYNSNKTFNEFEIEIKLSSDFKIYFSGNDIPKELQESYNGFIQNQNKFDSFEELNTKILQIIEDFESKFIEETKKKVILYSIDYDEKGGQQRIVFNYVVVQKIETKTKKGNVNTKYYEERLVRGQSLNQIILEDCNTYGKFEDKFNEMIWSKQRELWFARMSESVKDLGNRLLEGFGERAEILAKKIDQGSINLLLSGSNQD